MGIEFLFFHLQSSVWRAVWEGWEEKRCQQEGGGRCGSWSGRHSLGSFQMKLGHFFITFVR